MRQRSVDDQYEEEEKFQPASEETMRTRRILRSRKDRTITSTPDAHSGKVSVTSPNGNSLASGAFARAVSTSGGSGMEWSKGRMAGVGAGESPAEEAPPAFSLGGGETGRGGSTSHGISEGGTTRRNTGAGARDTTLYSSASQIKNEVGESGQVCTSTQMEHDWEGGMQVLSKLDILVPKLRYFSSRVRGTHRKLSSHFLRAFAGGDGGGAHTACAGRPHRV